MRALRLPMHHPYGLRFVSLPHRYRGARRCSLPRRPRAARPRPGHLVPRRASRAGSLARNAWDLPGSWATLVRSPRSRTPGRPRAPGHTARRCCRHLPNGVGPSQLVISRLYLAALALAVYASRPGSLQISRKTRFRLVASLYRAGASPAGLLRKVSMSRAIRYISPSPRLRLARSE
jgi:hypothetical protein